MTEHKFTDEEIIRALNLCRTTKIVTVKSYKCEKNNEITTKEEEFFIGDVLDLINRQNEKITIQQKIIDNRAKEIFRHDSFIRDLHKQIETVKAEAVKEFAEGLKTYYRHIDKTAGALIEYTIDTKVKEFLGGVIGAADSQDNA